MQSEKLHPDLELFETKLKQGEAFLNKALLHPFQTQTDVIASYYLSAIDTFKEALAIRTDRSYCIGPKWQELRGEQHLLRFKVTSLENDLNEMANKSSAPKQKSKPNRKSRKRKASSEVTSASQSNSNYDAIKENYSNNYFETPNILRSFSEDDIEEMPTTSNYMARRNSEENIPEVSEVFLTIENASIVLIDPQDCVIGRCDNLTLKICKIIDKNLAFYRIPFNVFIQIDCWEIPLNQSSQICHYKGGYRFKLLSESNLDYDIGLFIPAALKADFESKLSQYTTFDQEAKDGSVIVSEKIVSGAEIIAQGITRGAEATGGLIQKGAHLLKRNIQPQAAPVAVNPNVKKDLQTLKAASSMALNVTSYLVGKIGQASVALANAASPHVFKGATKLLSNVMEIDEVDSQDKLTKFVNVASGSITGITTIFSSLNTAACTVASSIGEGTVALAHHKYGAEVGEAASLACDSIGNIALLRANYKALKTKALAKQIAKDTAKSAALVGKQI